MGATNATRRRRLHAAVSYYRQGGSAEVLRRLCASGCLAPSAFFFSTIQVYALGAPNQSALKRAPRGYAFMRADAGALTELLAAHMGEPAAPARVLARFFELGQDCFVVRRHDAVVAYFWVFKDAYQLVFGDHPRRRLALRLRADQRFFGNGFIAPAQRLKGLFPHLVQFVVGHYPAPTRFFSSVNALNAASVHAHHRFGFAPVLRVTCAQAGALRLFYAQPPLAPGSIVGWGRTPIDLDGCLGRERPAAHVPGAADRI